MKTYLAQVLGEEPISVAPGVFYVSNSRRKK